MPSEKPAAKSDASSSELEALAVKTLSEYLGSPAEGIEVVSIVPIDWPDSSIGCPRPDRSYLQVITPGHKAVLRQGGATYQVHMAGKRAFVCAQGLAGKAPKEALAPQLLLPLAEAQKLARSDLAHRLRVPVAEISLGESKEVVWQDGSLGCPEPGQTYKTNPTRGYVVNLDYHGRVYTYHTDRYTFRLCPPLESQ
jgi:hypothetical protein